MTARDHASIVIALSKGRILEKTLPLLKKAGIEPLEDMASSRKLMFDSTLEHVRLLIVRASDAATYVEYGAADMGVVGKDVLMETATRNVYELLDLNIARCRMMVAVPSQTTSLPAQHIKVASKYERTAADYFARQGRQVDVIKLYGSMELAPLVGLADCIVDLVDTGNTLKSNDLVPTELICHISSRLIVNKAAMKLKKNLLQPVIDSLMAAVNENGE